MLTFFAIAALVLAGALSYRRSMREEIARQDRELRLFNASRGRCDFPA